MAHDLTDTDRALIGILHENGRAPFAEIARELAISSKTVAKRVGDLVAAGVVQIVTITDPQLLGYEAIALVGMRLDHSRPSSEVAADLAAIPAVDYVIVTTGRFNLLVELLATDTATLARTIEEQVLAVAGIGASEVFPYLRLAYQDPRLLTARRGRAAAAPATRGVDAVDRAILEQLSVDGRMPFLTVGRALGVSEAQVRQRVNRMVEGGVTRVLALTNPASLGFRTSAWLSISAAPGASVVTLADRVAELPAVSYVAVTAGRFDVFAEAICADQGDLLSMLDDELRRIDGVAGVEAAIYLELRSKVVAAPDATTIGERTWTQT
ncbi:MAG TPA: AsnC family transcriptional regulator [Baekduia sp.]|nr:AsnC family transcriptional regulator [Baekduia sp.]